MLRQLLTGLAALLPALPVTAATPSSHADLKVETSRLDAARPMNTYMYTAFVRNGGDDTARNVELIILLPLNAQVGSIRDCTTGAANAGAGTTGIVRCRFGDLTVRDARQVKFLIRTDASHPACTAIAVSDTPDPNPMNNIRN